mmetsp:Transcript_10366/g.30436  ORF Transcript_10366/g.30436 Transcript_10366/m.30436 type:complete len:446 (+) Transcript_10366:857-2194(+)
MPTLTRSTRAGSGGVKQCHQFGTRRLRFGQEKERGLQLETAEAALHSPCGPAAVRLSLRHHALLEERLLGRMDDLDQRPASQELKDDAAKDVNIEGEGVVFVEGLQAAGGERRPGAKEVVPLRGDVRVHLGLHVVTVSHWDGMRRVPELDPQQLAALVLHQDVGGLEAVGDIACVMSPRLEKVEYLNDPTYDEAEGLQCFIDAVVLGPRDPPEAHEPCPIQLKRLASALQHNVHGRCRVHLTCAVQDAVLDISRARARGAAAPPHGPDLAALAPRLERHLAEMGVGLARRRPGHGRGKKQGRGRRRPRLAPDVEDLEHERAVAGARRAHGGRRVGAPDQPVFALPVRTQLLEHGPAACDVRRQGLPGQLAGGRDTAAGRLLPRQAKHIRHLGPFCAQVGLVGRAREPGLRGQQQRPAGRQEAALAGGLPRQAHRQSHECRHRAVS